MTHRFSNDDLKRLILPLFFEQLLMMLVGVADTFMVSFAGDAAVSGVLLVNMFVTFFIYVFTALAAGGAVVVSQYIGRRDEENAGHTKFTPQAANGKPTAMQDMIEMQLNLMELDRFDIYWIHNVVDAPHWTEELAKFYEGKDNVPLLGVSNHNLAEIKQANEILKAHGLRLSAVQNHFSLINRSSEDSGILDYCKENDITFFAYMVLEQGALSGKYDTKHPMPEGSARAETYNPMLPKLEVMNGALRKLADKYGVQSAQIPVAWAIAKGTLPIIGVTKTKHVEDAVKAANVTLTVEETSELEKLADSLELNVIRFWEKEMK